MFHLLIRAKPQSRAFEVTEDEVREASIKALLAAGSRSATLPDCITTDTRSVISRDAERMKSSVQIFIYTGAPDWLGLSTDNKIERFIATMKKEIPRLQKEGVSVFIVDAQYYSG